MKKMNDKKQKLKLSKETVRSLTIKTGVNTGMLNPTYSCGRFTAPGC